MFLNSLILQDFRNFKKQSFSFNSDATLISGPNAAGKTNILEAIYLLATGKSFRASKESEMIRNGEELARIWGKILDKKLDDSESNDIEGFEELEIVLTKGELQGKKTARKLFKINRVGKRWKEFAGILKCVLFRPEDIDIVLGTPSERRNFLDLVLEQIDWQYKVSIIAYKKGLRQRNRLLEKIREGEAQRAQLTFWNQLLIKNGNIITEKRAEYIDFINQFLDSCDTLYQENTKIQLEYDKSAISMQRLDKYANAEIGAGITLVGPQRDDLIFWIHPCKKEDKKRFQNNRNLALFGSRGEQRMAVFVLKLAEVDFVFKKTAERPLLLLDDIFSELDKKHRNHVVKIIPQQQTIITTTDANMIDKKLHDKIEVKEL